MEIVDQWFPSPFITVTVAHSACHHVLVAIFRLSSQDVSTTVIVLPAAFICFNKRPEIMVMTCIVTVTAPFSSRDYKSLFLFPSL